MAMSLGGRGASAPEMNVTPLIDVLLVLIIIFMVILPPHPYGELADIPQPSNQQTKQPTPDATIVIQLKQGKDGERPTLKINQSDVSWDDLESRLHDIFKLRAERVAFVKGDSDIDFEFVAQAIDITHHAGVDRVGLLDQNHE